jgi:hypothetical protein
MTLSIRISGGLEHQISGLWVASVADSRTGCANSDNVLTIKLRVTDSATKTSTVETTVNILPGTAVIDEPSASAGTALNGASGNNHDISHSGTGSGLGVTVGSLFSRLQRMKNQARRAGTGIYLVVSPLPTFAARIVSAMRSAMRW